MTRDQGWNPIRESWERDLGHPLPEDFDAADACEVAVLATVSRLRSLRWAAALGRDLPTLKRIDETVRDVRRAFVREIPAVRRKDIKAVERLMLLQTRTIEPAIQQARRSGASPSRGDRGESRGASLRVRALA